jgi:hypothetical protein
MLYPSRGDYISAIRNPQISFKHNSQLINGNAVEKPIGILKDPWNSSGKFAIVFKYKTYPNNHLWAIRCFLQSQDHMEIQYKKVSQCVNQNNPNLSCFIDFEYLEKGILVNGSIYPIVKMEWSEGKNLRKFIKDNLLNTNKLNELAQSWLNLSENLINAGIAHGDLQHGNILINDSNGVKITLIDYDSLYYQSIDKSNKKDYIKGIPDYQHPSRNNLQFQCLELDYFSQIVIYLSILAFAEQPQLWQELDLDNKEHLLFSEQDFKKPDQVQIFNKLSKLSSTISDLSNALKKICKFTEFKQIPSLNSLALNTPLMLSSPILPVDATHLFVKPKPNKVSPSQSITPVIPVDATHLFTQLTSNPPVHPSPQTSGNIDATHVFTQSSQSTPSQSSQSLSASELIKITDNYKQLQLKYQEQEKFIKSTKVEIEDFKSKLENSKSKKTMYKITTAIFLVTSLLLSGLCYQQHKEIKEFKTRISQLP